MLFLPNLIHSAVYPNNFYRIYLLGMRLAMFGMKFLKSSTFKNNTIRFKALIVCQEIVERKILQENDWQYRFIHELYNFI